MSLFRTGHTLGAAICSHGKISAYVRIGRETRSGWSPSKSCGKTVHMEYRRQDQNTLAGGASSAKSCGLVVPNPKLKLTDPVREVLRMDSPLNQVLRDAFRGAVPWTGQRGAIPGRSGGGRARGSFNARLFLHGCTLRQPFDNVREVRAGRVARLPVKHSRFK